MAWLEIIGWCKECWWNSSEEWHRPNNLISEEWHRPNNLIELQEHRHLDRIAFRYLYKRHRKEKPNCKARKLRFVAGKFTPTEWDSARYWWMR